MQELIAPDHVEFYSEDWTLLGTKKNSTFLSRCTGRPGVRPPAAKTKHTV